MTGQGDFGWSAERIFKKLERRLISRSNFSLLQAHTISSNHAQAHLCVTAARAGHAEEWRLPLNVPAQQNQLQIKCHEFGHYVQIILIELIILC